MESIKEMKNLFVLFFALISWSGFAQSLPNSYSPTSGTDVYTANVSSFTGSYTLKKAQIQFKETNTGPATININGLGAIELRLWNGSAYVPLVAGDIVDEEKYDLIQFPGPYMAISLAARSSGGGTQDLQDVLDNGPDITATSTIGIAAGQALTIGSITNTDNYYQIGDTQIIRASDDLLIHVDENDITISDSRLNTFGLQYESDYSAGFNERSLVDKEYVDNAVSAGGGNVTTRNIIPNVEYKVNDYTLVPGDTSTVLIFSGSVSTLTLGDFSALPSGKGYQYFFHNDQATSVTVDPDGNPYKFSLTIADSSFGYILFANDTFRIARTGTSSGGGSGVVETIVAGNLIDVDATDPANPIASVETGDKGDITIGANSLQIDALAVTNAEINDVAVGKITGLGAGIGTYLGTPTWTNFLSATTGTAPYWATTGTSTLTGSTIIANGGNTLTFNGAAGTTISHTVPTALTVTGTVNPTTANNQEHVLVIPNITVRPTASDVTSAMSIEPIMAAQAASNIFYGLNVDMAGASTTNSPQIYAINANGGGNFTMSSTATSPYALRVNRTTGSGDIATFQSNSTDLVLIRNASGSTAMSILPPSGGLATALNLGGTVTAASGSANLETISGTFLATANSDVMRGIRSIPVYGANSRTNAVSIGYYHNPSFTISSGSWAFQGGIVVDNTTSGVNLLNGFNLPTGSIVSTMDVDGSMGVDITSTAVDITANATHHTILVDASGAARTITLPAAASSTRRVYVVKKTDSGVNTVTVDGNASETIDGATTNVISLQYKGIVIQCDGSAWHVIGTF
jgi:hypothetical protein